ncbi:MAG: PQQ-binding-like beta-propeller repeat protein [Chloroflexi bacterium]|nr:PQQ-binding-like beta-propeller repeat protein [Chloroflexota bacterium]
MPEKYSTESNPVRAIRCPSCGASVEMIGDQAKCAYCGTTLERSRPLGRERVVIVQPPAPTSAPATTGSAAGGLVTMLVIMGLIVGVVLVGMWLSESRIGRPSSDHVMNWLPILLPTDYPGVADLVLVTRDLNADDNNLVLVDGVTRALRWRKSLGQDSYSPTVIVDGERLYLSNEARLYALDLATGRTIWEAVPADVLPSPQQDCLQVFGDRVVVLTKDGTAQAFDADTGKPAWSVRLSQTPRQLLNVAGQPAVLDQPEDARGASLLILNLLDGSVDRQITPVCRAQDHPWDQTATIYSPMLVDNTRGVLYVLLGHGPLCVQCITVATGDVAWTATIADLNAVWTTDLVLVDDALYITGGTSGHTLDAVDLDQGTARRLADEPDYALTVLAARPQGPALVHAERTRGSTRDELWALDPATGDWRWRHVLQGVGSFDNWAAQIIPLGVAVLWVPDDEAQLHLDVLGANDAQVLQSGAIELRHNDLGTVAWTGTRAYVPSWGQLFVVNLETARLEFAWP